jgi:hypothetical protein
MFVFDHQQNFVTTTSSPSGGLQGEGMRWVSLLCDLSNIRVCCVTSPIFINAGSPAGTLHFIVQHSKWRLIGAPCVTPTS